MDGVSLTIVGALVGSQFMIYYKLGRIEAKLKYIERKICNGGKK